MASKKSQPAATKSAAPEQTPAPPQPPAGKPANKSAKQSLPALFIRSRSANGFRRCGFGFNRHGYGIALNALTEDQIKTLKNEPHLMVEECEIDAPEQGE